MEPMEPSATQSPRGRLPVQRRYVLIALMIAAMLAMAASAASASAMNYGFSWRSYEELEHPEVWEAMSRSGATEFRMPVGPKPNAGHTPWKTYYDTVFRLAAEHGITILAMLGATEKRYPTGGAELVALEEFTTSAVERYGKSGSFWTEHPELPYKPVETWEVWNEPNLAENSPPTTKAHCNAIGSQWNSEQGSCAQPEAYAGFLNYISGIVQEASQKTAKVNTGVLFGGLWVSPGGYEAWKFLKEAYKYPGVSTAFTGLAIHPYGLNPGGTGPITITESVSGINEAHVVLKELEGSTTKPIWITEVGWATAGTEGADGTTGRPVTQTEQANLLTEEFAWIKREASTLNIHSVFWYNIQDSGGSQNWAEWCGLRETSGNYKLGWYAFEKATGATAWPFPAADEETAGPHAIASESGNVDIFFRTAAGELAEDWYVSGSGWGHQLVPGPKIASEPHEFFLQNGGVDVFFRTPENELAEDWWTPGSGWASQVISGPKLASDPYVTVLRSGVINVFFRTQANTLGDDWWTPGIGFASTTISGPQLAGDPKPVVQENGMLNVFFRTPEGQLGNDWYVPGSGWSSSTEAGPTLASDPHPVVLPGGGSVDIFFRTTTNELGEDWYVPGSGWGQQSVPGPEMAGDPHPLVLPGGYVDVFFRTAGAELGEDWYAGAGWASTSIGGPGVATEPHPILMPNGTIDVFYRTPASSVGETWYVPGVGLSWTTVPGPSVTSDPQVAAQPNGIVDLFFRTSAGELGHDWYVPGGSWATAVQEGAAVPTIRTPTITGTAAPEVSANEAVVSGNVTPNGSPTEVYVEYGKTTEYGSKTQAIQIGYGTSERTTTRRISGLSPSTTYHVRVVGTGVAGTTHGSDLIVKTPAS